MHYTRTHTYTYTGERAFDPDSAWEASIRTPEIATYKFAPDQPRPDPQQVRLPQAKYTSEIEIYKRNIQYKIEIYKRNVQYKIEIYKRNIQYKVEIYKRYIQYKIERRVVLFGMIACRCVRMHVYVRKKYRVSTTGYAAEWSNCCRVSRYHCSCHVADDKFLKNKKMSMF